MTHSITFHPCGRFMLHMPDISWRRVGKRRARMCNVYGGCFPSFSHACYLDRTYWVEYHFLIRTRFSSHFAITYGNSLSFSFAFLFISFRVNVLIGIYWYDTRMDTVAVSG